jgi:type IX secretion system PorP/SprF family membrane protein
MGEYSMFSVGASAAYVQRSVDFNKLSFDEQWDGFRFDASIPNGESGYLANTSFLDISAGVNYALFPNENMYLKVGIGMAHITRPKESFYGQTNKLGIRPTANIDLLLKLSSSIILNPTLYYTTQKSASEFLYGTLFQVNLSNSDKAGTQLIVGGHHRWSEAVVGTIGMQFGNLRVMSSYDFTISSLSPANKGRGAFELALRYEGLYGEFSRTRQSYNCPRF